MSRPPWERDPDEIARIPDLTVEIECRTQRDGAGSTRHEVTLHSDWSVTTPHDVEAERVGMALGGYCSCVDLVRFAVPLLRRWAPQFQRFARLSVEQHPNGYWETSEFLAPCCYYTEWATLQDAVAHFNSAPHVIHSRYGDRRAGDLESQVAALSSAVESAGRERILAEDQPARRLVASAADLERLWAMGIGPEMMEYVAGADFAFPTPMPLSYFVDMVYGFADRDWLLAVMAGRPDPEMACTLAALENPEDLGTPAEWRYWLDLGLPAETVAVMIRLGVTAQEHERLGRALDAEPDGMAALAAEVSRWRLAGCDPRLADFQALRAHGLTGTGPHPEEIDLLCEVVHQGLGRRDALTSSRMRTELALMREILGDDAAVIAALSDGTTSAADLATRAPRLW